MIAFINAKLIDGTGKQPAEKATVIINGTHIEATGTNLAVPDEASVVDLKGKTLLPAFSDAHTHFGGSDLLSRPALGGRDITYDYALNSINNLQWGVTTIRSAGDYMPDIISFRDDVSNKKLNAPRILTAGRMFVASGGHPLDTVYGSNEAIRDNACVVCYENTDIDAAVKTLIDAGVDWIKAFISTINKMNYPQSVPRISHETLIKITETAHKYGKPVMLHIENPAEIEEALEIGVDSIEHTIGVGNTYFGISDSLLIKLRDKKTFVVPTLSAIKAHDGMLQGAELVYPYLEKVVKKMAIAGVKLAVGCDSGIPFLPYGECVHMEMELLVAAGVSPMDAICIATRNNAELFQMQDKLGTVQAGKLADLVILNADPLRDIDNTRQICLVMKEGRVMIDRLLSE
jgi:imidazolonepropionase-like amidohydrolase